MFVNLCGGRREAARCATRAVTSYRSGSAPAAGRLHPHMLRHSHGHRPCPSGVCPSRSWPRLLTHRSSPHDQSGPTSTSTPSISGAPSCSGRSMGRRGGTGEAAAFALGRRQPPQLVHGGRAGAGRAEYAADHWDAARLGVAIPAGPGAAHWFEGITQAWLREPVKAGPGSAWPRLCVLHHCRRGPRHDAVLDVPGPAPSAEVERRDGQSTRAVLESYLSWLAHPGRTRPIPSVVAEHAAGILRRLPAP